MIRIEPVDFIPDLPYTALARLDISEHEWNKLNSSEVIFVALEDKDPLFCVGVFKATFLSKPFIWVLACEALSIRHVRELRKLFHEMNTYESLWTVVRDDFFQALAFAKFFGFNPDRKFSGYTVMER